ncbi:MAG: substrate-binding domain-containing protein [Promethearchaeota archaeon]
MQNWVKYVIAVVLTAIIVGPIVWFAKPAPFEIAKTGEGLTFYIITNGSPGDPYWAVVKKGVDDAAAMLGVNAIFQFSPGDIPGQVADFDTAIAAGADGIACSTVDSTAFDDSFQQAIDQGIPVAQIIVADDEWTQKGVPYLGFSLYDSGVILGKYFADNGLIKNGDNLLISAEVWASYAVDRREGFLNATEAAGITVNVNLLETTDDTSTAQSRITSFLAANPEIDAAIGVGGITTERTSVSVQNVGVNAGDIKVGGFDLLPETVEGIKNGWTRCSVMGQQYLNGYYTVLSLFMQAKSDFEMASISFGWLVVDSGNIADVEAYVTEGIK